MAAPAGDPDELLEPLRADPGASAVLSDVDGTLAPVVRNPEQAAVLAEGRQALSALADRYGLVACISGRSAADVRRMVGLDGLTYVGNHGLERLEPGQAEPRGSAVLLGHEGDAAAFADALDPVRLQRVGLQIEDKGPIQALHWRGAEDQDAAERAAAEIAAEAERGGLSVHRGRKVLELRPPVRFDKGVAIVELLGDHPVRHALYAGDDRTDLDGFRHLRELASAGDLDHVVCVGIASPESPPEVSAAADIVVADPAAFVAILRVLVG